MTYILIIVAFGWWPSISTVDGFSTKAACEVARSDIGRHIDDVWTACITRHLK